MLRAENIVETMDSTEFDISYLWKPHHIISKLPGKFNVYNILAALSVIIQMWLDIEKAIASIQAFQWVEGRMEKVEKDWINYFIDFAHTPDALEKTLDYLTQIKKTWKLILLFWAPWNRDKVKRPIMWEVAAKYADIIIATDDDPDTEDRMEILSQLTQNIKNKSEWENFFVIPDRELAMQQAIKLAKPWDIVMFAGKWHEKVQLTNKWKRKRNDKEELLKNLNSNI
jgi:UDP-N-acetylmuramyl tripeptide synthase